MAYCSSTRTVVDSAYGQAVFAYQAEVKQAREASRNRARRCPRPRRRNGADPKARGETFRSTASPWTRSEGSGGKGLATTDSAMKAPENGNTSERWRRRRDAAERSEAAGPPLNIIQKTYRAEALGGCSAPRSRLRFTERLVAFWSNISASRPTRVNWRECGPARSSASESALMCSGVRRHAEGGRAASQCCSFLDNQQSLGPDSAPGKIEAWPERKSRARNHGVHTLGVGGGYSRTT